MKALQITAFGQPLALRELPVPPVGRRDVLVRVKAAGICHSDAHYRAGTCAPQQLPITLGHEVAGVVEKVGADVATVRPADSVGVHYLATCGECRYCRSGHQQFCPSGRMMGKHVDGGYAEFVVMPAQSIVTLPPGIPFEHAAVMMCSTATAFHALQKGRLATGERVAVFGAGGGLGMSAIQLARALGAVEVFAVDIRDDKLEPVSRYGAIPINAATEDPVSAIKARTDGRGADVALELVGLPRTMDQSVRCLAPMGRAVMVGLGDELLKLDVYRDVLGKEAEIVGSSDHLLGELTIVLEMARQGRIDFSHIVTRAVPLEAQAVNDVLDSLVRADSAVRTVIVP